MSRAAIVAELNRRTKDTIERAELLTHIKAAISNLHQVVVSGNTHFLMRSDWFNAQLHVRINVAWVQSAKKKTFEGANSSHSSMCLGLHKTLLITKSV